MANENKMNIIEALIKLRNDLKLWVANNLNLKVDKVEGKGLSTNDYTETDKTALTQTIPTELNNLKSDFSTYQQVQKAKDDEQDSQIGDQGVRLKATEDILNELNEVIRISEQDDAFYIIDKDENVIFRVDNQGVSTTGLFASNLTFNNNYNMQLNGVFVDSDKLKDIEVEFDIED